jgi:hypothetical protein
VNCASAKVFEFGLWRSARSLLLESIAPGRVRFSSCRPLVRAVFQQANWTLHLQDVSGAAISGIQILNDPRIPNNDGIDCMICRNVRISITDSRALPGTLAFLHLNKVTDRRVFVNYDLKGASQAIEPANPRFDMENGVPAVRQHPVTH